MRAVGSLVACWERPLAGHLVLVGRSVGRLGRLGRRAAVLVMPARRLVVRHRPVLLAGLAGKLDVLVCTYAELAWPVGERADRLVVALD